MLLRAQIEHEGWRWVGGRASTSQVRSLIGSLSLRACAGVTIFHYGAWRCVCVVGGWGIAEGRGGGHAKRQGISCTAASLKAALPSKALTS